MGFDKWVSHDNFFELNPHLSFDGGPPTQIQGESSEIVVDETIKFIADSDEDKKPFLAVVWFGSPHEPYSGLPEDLALYDDLPEEYAKKMVSLTSNETGKQVKRPLRDVLRERFAEITAMDRAIGKLRTYLKAQSLKQNTLLWYCGDNGTPRSGIITSPFRGQKGQVYEGGVRVPGVIEWPARISQPITSHVPSVTSDILPTVCSLAGIDVPNRPLDGANLAPLFDGSAVERSQPICFWNYAQRRESRGEPYIDPELQKGTTPLVKLSGGIPTRNFQNFHHPKIVEEDYWGSCSILGARFKLVIHQSGKRVTKELFDMDSDPAEKNNVLQEHPAAAEALETQMHEWKTSVLTSLTGSDY